jgi:crotonobetainyl-CoA:carnitine CoA-transferase CaiB-like acyl-CoA transferase
MASTWADEAFAAPGAARVSCESLGVSCFDAILPPAMSLPLSGITVLSLEQAIAAPLGSRHLADRGARPARLARREELEALIETRFSAWTSEALVEPVMGPIPALGEHTDKILAELDLPLGHSADREAPRS